jgi:RNA recognition motif-containing protein
LFDFLLIEAEFKQHLEGRKHKKLESVRDEREKSALRSIFVTGLKKDIFVKNLEEYFQKYGKILKIVVDKEKVSLTFT